MKKAILPALAALLLLIGACTDKETEIGLGLTDSATQYNGITCTFPIDTAFSVRDDSLLTSNYSYGIIGNYVDNTYGRVKSILYSQIGLASGTSTIDFDEVTIDSVVLSLVSDGLFPDTHGSYNMHFVVRQLAEPVLSDTDYYCFSSLPVDPSATFFDQTVSVSATDTVVRLRLSPSIGSLLSRSGESDEFISATKGLRVEIADDADMGMLSINFASSMTCLTAYYHYGDDTTTSHYDFMFGGGVTHFTQFEHDYSGTIFDGADRVSGQNCLYLEPLAGYNFRISFDKAIRDFHEAHPFAVIHHAEMILPLTYQVQDSMKPGQLVAMSVDDSGALNFVPDYTDPYTYHGFGGTYDCEERCYRIRITQHLQRLLRQGYDNGTAILLDARRSSAQRTIITGIRNENPPSIKFVYTE